MTPSAVHISKSQEIPLDLEHTHTLYNFERNGARCAAPFPNEKTGPMLELRGERGVEHAIAISDQHFPTADLCLWAVHEASKTGIIGLYCLGVLLSKVYMDSFAAISTPATLGTYLVSAQRKLVVSPRMEYRLT
jgi:hypothetical protein